MTGGRTFSHCEKVRPPLYRMLHKAYGIRYYSEKFQTEFLVKTAILRSFSGGLDSTINNIL